LFFATYSLGKRTKETCGILLKRFQEIVPQPTAEKKLDLYTDGNFQYEEGLPDYFPIDALNYGQIIKVKKKGRVVEKKTKVIFGEPDWIETVNVECHNSIIRGKVSRLVRKTKSYSKEVSQLDNHIALFQFYWNFIKPLHGKLSPGMEEGLTHKLWTWGNFLHYKLTFVE
jgi:IS1 family transposase